MLQTVSVGISDINISHYVHLLCRFYLKKKCPLGSEITFPDDCPELPTATKLRQEGKQNFHRYKSKKLSQQFGFIEVRRYDVHILNYFTPFDVASTMHRH